jgi:hypothetical protein
MEKQIPQYRVLLRDAWRLTKSHKQLWVWGFFASLLGSFGEYETVGRIFNSISIASGEVVLGDSAFTSFYSRILGSIDLLWGTVQNLNGLPLHVLLLSILIVVSGLLLLWLSFTAVIALIAETKKLSRRTSVSLSDGFLASQKHIVVTILIYFFGRILMSLVGLLLLLFGSIVLVDLWLGVPLLLTSFIVLIPLLFTISFVSRFSIISIITKGRSMHGAIIEGLELIKKHWLVTLEVAFVLLVITAIVSLFAVALLVVTAVPLISVAAVLFETGQLWLSQIMLFLGVLFTLAPVVAAATFIGTYQWVTWTLLFNSVTQRESVRSKIIRLAEKIISNRTISSR